MFTIEKDELISKLSDTDIIINFKDILDKIYPNLIKINSFCYDNWDDIVDELFYSTVYLSFSSKYGIGDDKENYNGYEFSIDKLNNKHYIQILSENKLLPCITGFGTSSIVNINDSKLIFLCFGDSIHSLTGGIEIKDALTIHFNYTAALLFDNMGIRKDNNIYWIKNELCEYKMIYIK